MYKPEEGYHLPNDADAKLWRYMDIFKLIDILETSSLFFACLTSFADPYEGMPSDYLMKLIAMEAYGATEGDKVYDYAKSCTIDGMQRMRKHYAVSCWHESEHESAAMWSIYSGSKGIAMQTTVGRLCDSFDCAKEDINIGRVRYFVSEEEGWSKSYAYPLWKRTSFEYEREVRAVVYGDPEASNLERGLKVPIDPKVLIEDIFMSPTSSKVELQALSALLRRYEIGVSVKQSRLYNLY